MLYEVITKKPQDWSGITLPWMSHGYEVEATPLQVLLAYATLANGGTLFQPYVVAEERDVYGNTVWKHSPEPIRRVVITSYSIHYTKLYESLYQKETNYRRRR